ncbi:MAG: hypothetical protein Q7J69_06080 [Candidatus Omnitrophota bacterium]|nr:hypothetical protein [Candidatus Omnitrophota bacterium]
MPEQEEILKLVALALNVPESKVTEDSSAENMNEWDSFGQLCIMQALWQKYPTYAPSQELQTKVSQANMANLKSLIEHPDIATATSIQKILELFK